MALRIIVITLLSFLSCASGCNSYNDLAPLLVDSATSLSSELGNPAINFEPNNLDGIKKCDVSIEVKQKYSALRCRIQNIVLDIPSGYVFSIDGYSRGYEYLILKALLPNIAPRTDFNHAEFEKNTWGNTVTLTLENDPNAITGTDLLRLYLAEGFGKLQNLEHASKFDIYHFLGEDIYVANNQKRVFFMSCNSGQYLPYPHCSVSEKIWGSIILKYIFSRDYVNDADKIDESIINRLDSFCDIT